MPLDHPVVTDRERASDDGRPAGARSTLFSARRVVAARADEAPETASSAKPMSCADWKRSSAASPGIAHHALEHGRNVGQLGGSSLRIAVITSVLVFENGRP